jgi:predicted transcriptional regulator
MMRTSSALLVLGAIIVPGAQADPELTFSLPGEIGGDFRMNGTSYVVLLFDKADAASLQWNTDGGSVTNITRLRFDQGGDDYPPVDVIHPPMAQRPFSLGAVTQDIASIVIIADEIDIRGSADGAHLVTVASATCGGQHFSENEHSRPRFRTCPAGGGAALLGSSQVNAHSRDLRLSASGVSYVEWTGLAVDCHSGACPTGGGWHPSTGIPEASVEAVYYEAFQLKTGHIELQGTAAASLFMGPSISLDVNGWARLPDVSDVPQCPGCSVAPNRTLAVGGDMRLADITPQAKDRASVILTGQITAAKLDESVLDPSVFGQSTLALGAVAVVAAAVGLAGKILAGILFTKLSKEKALEHPRRQLLYAYIAEHPGANFREIVRQSDLASGTARHHLSVLKRSGHIVEKPHGGTVRFFENHGKYETSWSSVVLLREEPLKQLHDWMMAHPNVPQKAILEGMEQAGWSRSTTQHRLLRLQEGGIAVMRPQGRLKFYSIATAPQPRRFGLPPVQPSAFVAS